MKSTNSSEEKESSKEDLPLAGLTSKSYLLILPLFMLGVLAFGFHSYRSSLWQGFNRLNQSTEDNILHSLALAEDGLKILAQIYDDELKEDFTLFMNAYKKEGGPSGLMDLDRIRTRIKTSADLFVITPKGTIVLATDKKDIGLDLTHVKAFWEPLTTKLKDHGPATFIGDFLILETLSGRLKKYAYWATEDGKYILEMGLMTEKMDSYLGLLDLGKLAHDFVKYNPYLSAVEIYNSAGKFEEGNTQSDEKNIEEIMSNMQKSGERSRTKLETDDVLVRYLYFKKEHNYGILDTSKILKLTYDKGQINRELRNLALIYLAIAGVIILLSVLVIYRLSSTSRSKVRMGRG